MGGALTDFADQSNLKLMFPAELARGIASPGVSGALTRDQALARLLAGTGMTYRYTSPDTVTLERPDPLKNLVNDAKQPLRVAENDATKAAPKKTGQDQPTVLEDMTVTASPLGDTSYNALDASTATKTDTPIMETPVSVQVVPQQVLRDQQIIKLDDALKNVSGVRRFEPGGSGLDEAFVVRGFEINNVYLDGLRLPGGLSQAGRSEFANVERIEVVKGPVGVLFGRIDPGGLINIVTRRPELTPSYHVQQQFGSFDTYRTTAGATGPVPGLEDLAYRLDFAYEQADSFIDFVDSERFFVAPVLTWNISEATRATLKLQYLHNEQVPINPIFVFGGDRPPDIRRSTFTGRPPGFPDPDFSESDEFIFGLDWSHDFNENWQVRQAYNGYIVDNTAQSTFCCGDFIGDGVHGRDTFLNPERPTTTHSLTTDLLGNFETLGLKHKLLLGYEYYDFNRDVQSIRAFGASNPSNFVDIFNPVPDPNPLIFDSTIRFNQFQRWHGVYVQDQIELPYHVYLMLGGRFDAAAGGFSSEALGINARVDEDHFSPRAGLLWQITPQWAVYGSYAESFGTESLFSAGRDGNPLDSEESAQWEVGLKTELLDGRFTGTLSYFDLTRTNIPTPDPDRFFAAQGFSVATGEVRHQGVELDVAGEILPGWNIIGNYAFLDSEITDDNNPAIVGNRFQGTPRHIGNLFTTYELQTGPLKGLKLGGGARAVDSFTGTNDETFTVPGHITANLLAAYEWKVGENQKVVAQLNIENLFDKKFVDFTTGCCSDFHFAAPRTFLGAIRVEF